MTDTSTKRCGACNSTKPVSDFHKNRNARDGLQGYCKACVSAYQRTRYLKEQRPADRIAANPPPPRDPRPRTIDLPPLPPPKPSRHLNPGAPNLLIGGTQDAAARCIDAFGLDPSQWHAIGFGAPLTGRRYDTVVVLPPSAATFDKTHIAWLTTVVETKLPPGRKPTYL